MSWIIGSSPVCIRVILLTQNSYSLQRSHRDVTSPHFVRSSHLPKSAVLDLLHAHRVSPEGLRLSRLNLFAIPTNFVSSVRKSARTNGSRFTVKNKQQKRGFRLFFIKWLLEPSKIRTLILDLHEAIKKTPNSYFEMLQDLL